MGATDRVIQREIVSRCETVHSMLRRLDGWDYRGRAIYQVTLVLADRASRALGRLEVRERATGDWVAVEAAKGLVLEPEAVEARVVASEIGEIVEVCWREIAAQWPGVSLLGFQLMPDHVHGLIFVERPMAKTLGNIVGSFKSKSASRVAAYWAARDQAARGLAQNGAPAAPGDSAAVRGPAAVGGPAAGFGGSAAGGGPSCAGARAPRSLWAPGYQDTVLLHEGQLANMKRYLADNPRRLAVKRLFPALFRVVRELALPLGGDSAARGRAQNGGLVGRFATLGRAQNGGLVGRFAALGNRFLLERPLVQVQVSRRDFGYCRELKGSAVGGPAVGGATLVRGGLKIRRDSVGEPIAAFSTPGYAEKKAGLFAAAKHGAVLISPCISDGERQIAREALKAGYPLVTLLSEALTPFSKPAGRLFDACAEGRLLMLVPAAWQGRAREPLSAGARAPLSAGARAPLSAGARGPFCAGARAPRSLSRFDAVALNRLCQWLAGDGAAEINYSGMRPANIDELAYAAVDAGEMTDDR